MRRPDLLCGLVFEIPPQVCHYGTELAVVCSEPITVAYRRPSNCESSYDSVRGKIIQSLEAVHSEGHLNASCTFYEYPACWVVQYFHAQYDADISSLLNLVYNFI